MHLRRDLGSHLVHLDAQVADLSTQGLLDPARLAAAVGAEGGDPGVEGGHLAPEVGPEGGHLASEVGAECRNFSPDTRFEHLHLAPQHGREVVEVSLGGYVGPTDGWEMFHEGGGLFGPECCFEA